MIEVPILISDGLQDNQIKFINAYVSNYCNVAAACRSAGISRQTFYHWNKTSDTFNEAFEQAKEGLKDLVEQEIHRHIFEDRNPVVLSKFAPKILKDRGYGDTQDINLNGSMQNDNEVVVTIIDGGEAIDYESDD